MRRIIKFKSCFFRRSHAEAEDVDTMPRNVIETIEKFNKQFLPCIYALLQIFERSFSSMKMLKTYLSNNMEEEPLSSLALLCAYRRGVFC